MIRKSTIKLIKFLAQKKYRKKHQLFFAEGDKNVLEVLESSFRVSELIATSEFLQKHPGAVQKAEKLSEASPAEIKKLSLQKSPQNCLAICAIPPSKRIESALNKFSLYLDGVQDPGNMGTIVRICDWFGIDQLFCSPDTVDIYNPKVIQASVGSFCRVEIYYTPFEKLAKLAKNSNIPVYGTFMKGQNLYNSQIPLKALVVLGNEGNGIRELVERNIQSKLSIPAFNKGLHKPQSLNVAVTAGIICSEFRRTNTNN